MRFKSGEVAGVFASRLERRVDGGSRRRRAGDGNMGLRRAWMYLQSDAVMDQSERVIREMGVDVEEMFGVWAKVL